MDPEQVWTCSGFFACREDEYGGGLDGMFLRIDGDAKAPSSRGDAARSGSVIGQHTGAANYHEKGRKDIPHGMRF